MLNKTIKIRVSEEELEAWKSMADAANQTVSEYIRGQINVPTGDVPTKQMTQTVTSNKEVTQSVPLITKDNILEKLEAVRAVRAVKAARKTFEYDEDDIFTTPQAR